MFDRKDDALRRGRQDEVQGRRAWLGVVALAAVPLVMPLMAASARANTAARQAAPAQARILIVGDSLSAEYGLRRGSGWVALLQARLDQRRPGSQVINASISGDTTAGGRARLTALLRQHRPTHVVIELGGNDALRGLPLDQTEGNLKAMSVAARAAGARVLLLGMQVPPNYGTAYTRDFAAMYQRVAKVQGDALLPFLLAGVADDADPLRWFQSDRIHPNEAAHPRILDNVWGAMAPWLGLAAR